MIAGAILGVLGGWFLPDVFLSLRFIGTLFLNALRMIVVPLVVASMIVGVSSLGDLRKLGRTAGKTVLFYFATTSLSVLVGIILVNLIRPGTPISFAQLPMTTSCP
jgi:Na+/H+-dicarboxylate symporter